MFSVLLLILAVVSEVVPWRFESDCARLRGNASVYLPHGICEWRLVPEGHELVEMRVIARNDAYSHVHPRTRDEMMEETGLLYVMYTHPLRCESTRQRATYRRREEALVLRIWSSQRYFPS